VAQHAEITPVLAEHVDAAGRLIYEAFYDIATRHGFPPVFDSVQTATGITRLMVTLERWTTFMICEDGVPIAVNFLDERGECGGVGPVAVAVDRQGAGLGRQLMEELLDRAARIGMEQVRLIQYTYNLASFSLYSSLGFNVVDLPVHVDGALDRREEPAGRIREAAPEEIVELAAFGHELLGYDRGGELETMAKLAPPLVAEREGRLCGYLCRFPPRDGTYCGYGAALDQSAMRDLVIAAARFGDDGPLHLAIPASQPDLLRWALRCGLRVAWLETLMAYGPYEKPAGTYIPSGWF